VKDKLTLKESMPFLPKFSDANTINNESKTLSLLNTGGHIEITGLP